MARKYTDEQKEQVCQLYATTTNEELSKMMGISIRGLYNIAFSMGLKKSKDILAINGHRLRAHPNCCKYQAGHVPFNKGKKWDTYLAPEQIERLSKTSFQTGHKPHNTITEIGAITKRDGYLYRKCEDGNFYQLHRWEWEQANGPIPKGHNIQFKDGNPLNCKMSNYYMISRKEQLVQNKEALTSLPPELQETKKLLNKLQKTIKQKTKQQ